MKIYGASDDLIEIDGKKLQEEFSPIDDDKPSLLVFSDGTVLSIRYDDPGIWRITPTVKGTAFKGIDQCEGDGSDEYSDIATLDDNGVRWVVLGNQFASTNK